VVEEPTALLEGNFLSGPLLRKREDEPNETEPLPKVLLFHLSWHDQGAYQSHSRMATFIIPDLSFPPRFIYYSPIDVFLGSHL
jgi:hypothetical protein